MKSNRFCLLVALGAMASGASGAVPEGQFGAAFSAYALGEVLSDKGAWGGAWQEIPDGASATNVLVGSENAIDFNTSEADGEVAFTNAAPLTVGKARYDFRASFDFADVLDGVPVDAQACGFTLGRTEGDALALAGAAGGKWHILTAPGFTPQLDTLYDLRLETQSVGGEAYVAFSVKVDDAYVTLSDASGNESFAMSRTAGENFSQVAVSGCGCLGGFSGNPGDREEIVVRKWVGSASGDWTNETNWADGKVPGAGDYVRVTGKTLLANGAESATVSNILAIVGADGKLTLRSGILDTAIDLDLTDIDKRPRVGKEFSLTVGSFMGLTPTIDCTWSRGTAADKAYEAEPVGTDTAYTFTTADCSHWFKVQAKGPISSSLSKEFFFSRLPVLYMTTDDGQTPTAAKEAHDGKIVTQCGETKWKDKNLFTGKMEIKVRGNSTRSYPKKPWKLKLDKKTNMFGLSGDEKNKHWVLLANYNDESNMRNKLAYDFANEIGSLGMKSTWVECILNGAWQGCYQFCEHIRIAPERVNIFNWEDEAEERGQSDTDFSWVDPEKDDITGGYLFESSAEFDELTKFGISSRKLALLTMLNAPEYLYTNQAMVDWCKNFLQNYCDSITAADGYSNEDKHWSEYCDGDSMATYFLVMEMFGNNDASYKSRYFYKDRGKKMKFGPVWDFDWGVGNGVVVGSTSATGWKVEGGTNSVYREWADDPWFCTRLHTLYHKKARAAFAKIVADGGTIDEDAAYLAEAGAANDTKWLRSGYAAGNYRASGFAGDVAFLRQHLTDRLAWLDKQFTDVPTLMASLKTSSSSSPYSRATTMLPIAFANAPTNVIAQGQSLHLAFTLGDSSVAKADVFANGLRVAKGVAVDGGALEAVIPASALTEAKGDPNCVSLVAYDAAGTLKGRNYVLVTLTDFAEDAVTPPAVEEDGTVVPSVPHEWVCKEVASIPGCENLSAATPEEFALAVRATPSPSGKQTPLWQDYVAGTDPDPNATSNTEFTVTSITIENGVPTITYSPDLGVRRTYTTEGKVNLTDEKWVSPAPEGAKFFRVKVALPGSN